MTTFLSWWLKIAISKNWRLWFCRVALGDVVRFSRFMTCILPWVTSGGLGEITCSWRSIYLLIVASCSVLQSLSIKKTGTWLELKVNTQVSLHLTVEVTCWWSRTPPGKTMGCFSLKQQSWTLPIPCQPQHLLCSYLIQIGTYFLEQNCEILKSQDGKRT